MGKLDILNYGQFNICIRIFCLINSKSFISLCNVILNYDDLKLFKVIQNEIKETFKSFDSFEEFNN